ncbi:fiber [Human mastadenovirus D]|uniref:Fiber n=1 Tax=Human mastadenovirus D TaxID=130310 RepID=T1UK39_9ADEN|nr:fiber [Human mastadenovirus D]
MAKRLRVEDDFNPVYPYGYARNQNIPFLTPPFVSSDGFKNFPPGVLSLKLADPITITNGDVSLKVGGGLTLQEGNLTVDAKAPLQVANDNKLELSYADPFEVKDTKLQLKVGHGLKVIDEKTSSGLQSLIGNLVVLTGKGIGTQELKDKDDETKNIGVGINVRIGKNESLAFDKDGNLVAWDNENDRRTLWTTPDTSPNCKISAERDSKLTLVLTKCGSQILANVSLLAVAGSYLNMTATTPKSIKVSLLFDSKGLLINTSSIDKGYWNYRNNNNVVGTAYENAIPFMPNLVAYPRPNTPDSKIYARSKIVGNVYLAGLAYQPIVITVSFNQENDASCAYSITFDFAWNKDYVGQFDTTSFTFSYIAQE